MSRSVRDPDYRRPKAVAAFQDALGDYNDAGRIGDPPKLQDFTNDDEGDGNE